MNNNELKQTKDRSFLDLLDQDSETLSSIQYHIDTMSNVLSEGGVGGLQYHLDELLALIDNKKLTEEARGLLKESLGIVCSKIAFFHFNKISEIQAAGKTGGGDYHKSELDKYILMAKRFGGNVEGLEVDLLEGNQIFPAAILDQSSEVRDRSMKVIPRTKEFQVSELNNLEETSSTDLERKTLIDGDPNVGKVIHMKQLHWRDENSQELNIIAGKYQLSLLKELKKVEITDLFSEGLHPEFDISARINAIKRDVLPRLPKDPYNDDFTDEQLFYLAYNGAGFIHKALSEEPVNIHCAARTEDLEHIHETVEIKGDTSETRKLYMTKHEELLVGAVSNFLNQNEGASSVVFFGASHDLIPHFLNKYGNEESCPVLESVENTSIIKEFETAFRSQ